MVLTPEQCATIAQIAPVFMLVVFVERRALMKASLLTPDPGLMRGMTTIIFALGLVTVAGIVGIPDGLPDYPAVLTLFAMICSIAAVAYLFVAVMRKESEDLKRQVFEKANADRDRHHLLRNEQLEAQKIADRVAREVQESREVPHADA